MLKLRKNLAVFIISSENVEKCRASFFSSDRDWTKSANGDMADFVKFLSYFEYKIHIFRDI